MAGALPRLIAGLVHPDSETRWNRWFWASLGVAMLFAAGYVVYGAPGLLPDEAYFWDLSRHPQLSYVEKPPLVNYVIWITTRFLGPTELGVRAGAVLLAALFSWITYRFGRLVLGSARSAFVVVVLLAVAPMPSAARFIMTPDSLLMVTWAASVWGLYEAILGDRRARWWVLVTLGLGLGFMAKYTIAFAIPCLGAFLLANRDRWAWFRRPALYVAVGIGLLGLVPSIVWNARHGWVTIQHMLWQAHVNEGLRIAPKFFFRFVGSQFLVVSPLFFVGLVWGVVWAGRRGVTSGGDREAFLFWFSAPILGLFILKSLQGNTLANWAAVAYFTASVAMALWFQERVARASPRGRRTLARWAYATCVTAALSTLLAYNMSALAQLGLPDAVKWDPGNQARGWQQVGRAAHLAVERLSRDGPTFLFSGRYQVTSELAFYVPGQPRVYCINWNRRKNQYDYWDDFRALAGFNAVFVDQGDVPTPGRLQDLFVSCERLPVVAVTYRGFPARTFSLFSCRHLHDVSSSSANVGPRTRKPLLRRAKISTANGGSLKPSLARKGAGRMGRAERLSRRERRQCCPWAC